MTYNFRKANFPALYDSLAQMNWTDIYSCTEVNQACDILYAKLYSTCDQFVPKTKKVSTTTYPIWFTRDIIEDCKMKKKMHNRYRRTKSEDNKKRLREMESCLRTKIKLAYKDFISNAETNISRDPKKIWSFINRKRNESRIPGTMKYGNKLLQDGQEIVNSFAENFKNSFTDQANNRKKDKVFYQHMGNLRITEEMVQKQIKKLKSRFTSGLDNIPEFVIKDAAPVLVSPLTHIYNICLTKGTFPDCWKKARITPIHKKGDKANIENYRPISLLCNFSKIFESVITTHLYAQLSPYISCRQHGFMKKRSTFTNLMTLSQQLSENIDNRRQTDVIYADLTKAFDRMPSSIVVQELQEHGVCSNVVKVIESYLEGRSFQVEYEGHKSKQLIADSGVPPRV